MRKTRPKSSRLALLCAAAAACAAAMASPAAASAGIYHVYSCRTPSGAPAPTEGWVPVHEGAYTYATNTCESGGALVAALGDQVSSEANDAAASWTFSPPATARLVGGAVWRSLSAAGGASIGAGYEAWLAAPKPNSILSECVAVMGCDELGSSSEPLATANRIEVDPEHAGGDVAAMAACGGVSEYECPSGRGNTSGEAAASSVYMAEFALEQADGPEASNVSGELASASTLSGTASATFTATDPGAGVYSATVEVDGSVVETVDLDSNGGRCANVGGTTDGTMAFLYLRPCLEKVNAAVELDTAKLSNGAHHLEVLVTDAAGNSAPVIDRTITVDNAASGGEAARSSGEQALAQPALTAHWAANDAQSLTVPFDRGATIAGRLVGPGGEPIADAEIEVSAVPTAAGVETASMANARTGSAGRFTLALPRSTSSRRITLVYKLHRGGAVATATTSLSLTVHAGVAMSIAPRVSSVGHSIHFSGRLLGGLVPASGKLLVLQARAPGGRWLDFDVIRSSRSGRFHAVYRFRFAGPAHYQFRALSEQEADYPFAAGASRVVGVFER